MELPLQSPFHKQTTREIKCIGDLPKGMLNLSVKPSKGSCESRKRPALFVEERNEKLQCELRENHAKTVSVQKQPPDVFYKKS